MVYQTPPFLCGYNNICMTIFTYIVIHFQFMLKWVDILLFIFNLSLFIFIFNICMTIFTQKKKKWHHQWNKETTNYGECLKHFIFFSSLINMMTKWLVLYRQTSSEFIHMKMLYCQFVILIQLFSIGIFEICFFAEEWYVS